MIPEEAVEAACDDWFSATGDAAYPDAMRAALEAAAPFLRAQALEDAADEWSDWDALQAPEAWLRARAVTERGGE